MVLLTLSVLTDCWSYWKSPKSCIRNFVGNGRFAKTDKISPWPRWTFRSAGLSRSCDRRSCFDLEGPYVQIDGERIKCGSIYEAKFIEYAVLAGKTRIIIPTDEDMLRRAVEERTKLLKDARAKLEEFLNETIADRKLREKVRFEAFRRLYSSSRKTPP